MTERPDAAPQDADELTEIVRDLIWAIHHSAQVFKRQTPEMQYRLAWAHNGEDGYIAGEMEGLPVPMRFTDMTVAQLEAAGAKEEWEHYVLLVRVARSEDGEQREARPTTLLGSPHD